MCSSNQHLRSLVNFVISPPTNRNSSEELFNFTLVTCSQVERIVPSMPSNKFPGPDKVSMRIIKDCLPVILGPLTDIINCSFVTSTFPNSWKASEVIPLLKDGDHEEPSKDHPLPMLTVASRSARRKHSNSSAIIYNVTASLINIKAVIVNTTLQRLLIL